MATKDGVGVIVGRFQVNWLHEAHLMLLHKANRHKKLLVFISQHPFLVTKENPLDYPTREKMVRKKFPNAIIVPLYDKRTDEEWSEILDTKIREICPIDSVTIYTGRDSLKGHYFGKFTLRVVDTIPTHSGSEIRASVGQEVKDSEDFRRGVIYGSINQFNRINPTVDIALIKPDKDNSYASKYQFKVLLGKKEGETKYRFPGGFVDSSDINFESAARRELQEETSLGTESELTYVGSYRIADWRSLASSNIFTTFYYAYYTHGATKANDDLKAVKWISFGELLHVITDEHRKMAEDLIRKVSNESA